MLYTRFLFEVLDLTVCSTVSVENSNKKVFKQEIVFKKDKLRCM